MNVSHPCLQENFFKQFLYLQCLTLHLKITGIYLKISPHPFSKSDELTEPVLVLDKLSPMLLVVIDVVPKLSWFWKGGCLPSNISSPVVSLFEVLLSLNASLVRNTGSSKELDLEPRCETDMLRWWWKLSWFQSSPVVLLLPALLVLPNRWGFNSSDPSSSKLTTLAILFFFFFSFFFTEKYMCRFCWWSSL